MNRPDIICLNSHDMGHFILPFGHAVATPNLQRLAERRVLCRSAFGAAPICPPSRCSPSRGALLTGYWPPHCNGLIELTHRGFHLGRDGSDFDHHLVRTIR